jgi:hypothetical protein
MKEYIKPKKMRELFKRRFEHIISCYWLEPNTKDNREKLISELNTGMNFNFHDITTIENIYDGYVIVEGLDPETKKLVTLTIQPTCYQFDIDGNETRRY